MVSNGMFSSTRHGLNAWREEEVRPAHALSGLLAGSQTLSCELRGRPLASERTNRSDCLLLPSQRGHAWHRLDRGKVERMNGMGALHAAEDAEFASLEKSL